MQAHDIASADPSSLRKLLLEAGWAPSIPDLAPILAIEVDGDGRPRPLTDTLSLLVGPERVPLFVRLPPVAELFRGEREPPSMKRPPDEYVFFFFALERTAWDYCSTSDRPEIDKEFNRLYRRLRDRPDQEDRNPLFGYLSGAARVAMCLREVSEAEYEALTGRLARSAKTFSRGAASRNYWQEVLVPLGEAG